MLALFYFLAGFLFMYVINCLDLVISVIQSKVSLHNSRIQVEINELIGCQEDQQLSYNIGFAYHPEEEYEEEYDDFE